MESANYMRRLRLEERLAKHQYILRASMLQWREELECFLQFCEDHKVTSFLEIGCANAQLSLLFKDVMGCSRVYSCDLVQPPLLASRDDIGQFIGDHSSAEYRAWRAQIGMIDMVLIDAEHYTGFRQDFEIESAYPHRFLAFHDVANTEYPALNEFWHQLEGAKTLFINTSPDDDFGVPELLYPNKYWKNKQIYEAIYGRQCGIGILSCSKNDVV